MTTQSKARYHIRQLIAVLRESQQAVSLMCRIIIACRLAGKLDHRFDGFGKRAMDAIKNAEKFLKNMNSWLFLVFLCL